MTLRRKAREHALQLLYQWELTGNSPAAIEESFWHTARAAPQTRAFAHQLFTGAVTAAPELDKLIAQHSKNWRFDRLAAIDRNILRLGAYELRFATAPAKVVMDEAVELAKSFSDSGGPAFVNGILDAIEKELTGGAKSARKEGGGK